MRRGALVFAVGIVALAALADCSLIVPSKIDPLHCSQQGKIGPPACEPEQICADGICVRCMSKEICGDGVDNDCNGVIDDGCGDAGAAPLRDAEAG